MRRHHTAILLPLCLLPSLALPQADADFVVVEAIRAEVDQIFESYEQSGSGVARMEAALLGVKRLTALGDSAVPYLINELEGERLATYDFCSYALGVLGGADATACLRRMVERAEGEQGDAAAAVKGYAIWGLSLAGDVSALDLLFTGRHRVASTSFHRNTSLAEAAAILTAPESARHLIDSFEKLTDDPDRWRDRRVILEALGRIAQPESIPLLTRTLRAGSEDDRRFAATALATLDAPESVSALVSVLTDESFAIRRTASRALAELGAPTARDAAIARLEIEEDPFVRGSLYRLLAEIGGADALKMLMTWSGRDDLRDRRFLVIAIGQFDDPAIIPILSRSLLDQDNGVALEAAGLLQRLGSPDALEALASRLPEMTLHVAHSAATLLDEAGYVAAADDVAARLERLLSSAPEDQADLLGVERLTDALIGLRHLPTLPLLDRTLSGELSRELRSLLEPRREQLALLKRNGKKLSRWLEAAASDDAALRRFAYRRIGELGTAAAARELVAAFDGADLPERFAIVNGLAHTPAEVAAPLLERVLLGEEFDALALRQLRDAAGWSARRLGGSAMVELLVAATERVDGRNPRLMVYVAQMDPQRAIQLFDSVKKRRFRSLGTETGDEQLRLDWIQRRLARGLSVSEFDLPPYKLQVR